MRDRYGELPEYIADSDRAWFRATVAEARAANPHASVVAWALPEFGVPQYAVLCSSCGQVAQGVDEAWLKLQAAEHEMAGRA
jgi:hypothetical protein